MLYNPGYHRLKHHWNEPRAGFEKEGSAYIGKCSSRISLEIAQKLLETGLKYPPENPRRVYNVHEGVVYEAVSSGNDEWHGYPWRSRPGNSPLPKAIVGELENRATQSGYYREFKDWIKEYGR